MGVWDGDPDSGKGPKVVSRTRGDFCLVRMGYLVPCRYTWGCWYPICLASNFLILGNTGFKSNLRSSLQTSLFGWPIQTRIHRFCTPHILFLFFFFYIFYFYKSLVGLRNNMLGERSLQDFNTSGEGSYPEELWPHKLCPTIWSIR